MEETKRPKENNPYFSLILPVYNVEAYLKECIDSILSQDFEDYEIILVDDGASDRCPEICDGYAEKYANIKVIHKINGGLSSARNAGLEIARGEYIWWVDSDDWIEESSLRRLFDVSSQSGPEIVKFRYFRSACDEKILCGKMEGGIYKSEDMLRKYRDEAFLNAGSFCLSAWGHVYKRAFLQENNFLFISEREIGSEDYLFNLQAMLKLRHVIVVEDALYNYRIRPGSLTQNYRAGLPEKYTRLYELLIDYYRGAGSEKKQERNINFFYAWHLIHGTCMGSEYRIAAKSDMTKSREKVFRMLGTDKLQMALKNCRTDTLDWKKKVQIAAMRCRFEPLFYWLYVSKKKRKENNL